MCQLCTICSTAESLSVASIACCTPADCRRVLTPAGRPLGDPAETVAPLESPGWEVVAGGLATAASAASPAAKSNLKTQDLRMGAFLGQEKEPRFTL